MALLNMKKILDGHGVHCCFDYEFIDIEKALIKYTNTEYFYYFGLSFITDNLE